MQGSFSDVDAMLAVGVKLFSGVGARSLGTPASSSSQETCLLSSLSRGHRSADKGIMMVM